MSAQACPKEASKTIPETVEANTIMVDDKASPREVDLRSLLYFKAVITTMVSGN